MANDSDDRQVEVRFMAPPDHVAVIDALSIAEGTDRATVMRRLLKQKVEAEVHRSTLVLRCIRRNPLAAEDGGKPTET